MKRSLSSLIFGVLALTTCGRDALDPANVAVESVVVSPSISTLAIGAQLELSAQVIDVTGAALVDRSVHWASENAEIATVSGDGTVTGKQIGTVQVAASTGGRSGLAQVTVTAVPVASVHVLPGNKALYVDESFQFAAETRDANGNVLTGRPVTWSSNNERVATVNATGLVTALSPGGAIITATAEGRSSPASVTVLSIPVSRVVVTPSTSSVFVGQSTTLTSQALSATGQPLTGRAVSWSSGTPAVATVNSAGVVTGVSVGSTVVLASIDGVVGSANVAVLPIPVATVTVSPATATVDIGKTMQLSAVARDASGNTLSGRFIAWTSNQASVATVTGTGLVTGVSTGTAIISATSEGKVGTATVTIQPGVPTVTVFPDTATLDFLERVKLTAVVRDPSGAIINPSVSWSSSNTLVAVVASDGTVTAMFTQGTAIISARYGTATGTATITVKFGS